MPAIKLSGFGGMIPVQDDLLLPDNAAAFAKNAWLYRGDLEGWKAPRLVRTLVSSTAKRVFRIPNNSAEIDNYTNSTWMEFQDQTVQVIRAPMLQDSYSRYYWVGEDTAPSYNTLARIQSGSAAYKLGVPAPTQAPGVRASSGYIIAANTGQVSVARIPAVLRYGTYIGSRQKNIANITRSSNVMTIATTVSHGYSVGEQVQVFANVVTASNVSSVFTIASTPTDTTFTVASTGSDFGTTTDTGTVRIVKAQANSNDAGVIGYGSYTMEPTAATAVTEVRSYVYTYVSAYGEEGPPSSPTVRTGTVDGSWVLSIPTPSNTVTTGRNLEKVRIYRTITASNGVATYFQVDEIPINQQGYTDTKGGDDISGNNQLESTYWTPPPEDLEGWVAMPNGILAGWRDNELWFCEPYRPHAWPASYQVSVDFPIVGLGVMGQTLIVATEGSPWAASGVRPSTISLAKINMFEPCTSRLSIVSTPGGVMYSSPNGLVVAVPGQVQVATASLLTPAQWSSLNDLTKLEAIRFGSGYLAYETPSATQTKGFIIDPSAPRMGYMPLLDGAAAVASIDTDPWTNDMLLIRGGKVYVVDTPDGAYQQPYLWRSKLFQLPYSNNLGAMKVYFTVPTGAPTLAAENTSLNQSLSSNQYGLVRVYADDTLVFTRELRTSGVQMRLPSGFRANTYQIEIEARVSVKNIQVAPSARELRGV